jgi:hypothetical protein
MSQASFIGGNTITVQGTVTDSTGVLTNFDSATANLIIYYEQYNKLSTIPMTSVSTGIYTGSYTLPVVQDGTILYYEVSGKVSGEVTLTRDSIEITFV